VSLDHVAHFDQLRDLHFEERFKVVKSLPPVVQRAKSNLRNDKRVHRNLFASKAPLDLRWRLQRWSTQMDVSARIIGYRSSALLSTIPNTATALPPFACVLSRLLQEVPLDRVRSTCDPLGELPITRPWRWLVGPHALDVF
jgi:hypothetical protein